MISLLRRLFGWDPALERSDLTRTSEPGFYPPGSHDAPTDMEKVICMKAFGDPKKLSLLREIIWYELFGLGEQAGTSEQRQAVTEAYVWYVQSR